MRRPKHNLRRRRKSRGDRRGIALVMVLAAITILTVMLTEFQDEASADLSAAISDRDALKAEYLARSGLNLSRLLIATEPTIRAAIAPLFLLMRTRPPQIPVWEFSDRVLGAFNDKEGGKEFSALAGVDLADGKNLGIEGGRFEVVIVDEDSKINVNVAARGDAFSETRLATQLMGLMAGHQYDKMFEERDADDQFSDRLAICSAFIDWADSDENYFNCDLQANAQASATTPEDSFYQMLKHPYRRKNAAFDSLQELRMVRGVDQRFWSTFVDPDPGDPKKRIMTVWGQGKVNVNTANPQTILAVICAGAPQAELCQDPNQAQMFLMLVGMIRGFTRGAPLFTSARQFVNTMKGRGMIGPMLTAMGIKPVVFLSDSETMKMVTTESKVFSIYSEGVVPGYKRQTRVRIHAVVDFRNAPKPGYAPMPGTNPNALGSRSVPFGAQPMGSATSQFGASGSANSPTSPEGIPGAMAPNPGGTIIYFRID